MTPTTMPSPTTLASPTSTQPRNVFFVGIDVDSLGGSQRVLHTLAQGLGGRGHRVHVIGIRTAPEPFQYNAVPTYRHTTLYQKTPPPAWRASSLGERLNPARNIAARRNRAEREAARTKLTRLFSEVEDGFVVFGSPWAADWALSLEWKHLEGIGQYHESFLQAGTSENKALILRHYPQLAKALFLSAGDAEGFEQLRLPNAGVMPNPIGFFPDTVAETVGHRVGAVGRLEAIKRLDRLISAFAMATAEQHTDWELHLIGDGPEEELLRNHAADLGVADRVVFRGRVEDMPSIYREMSIIALSSEKEGRPMALAEAGACGVPSIAFDLSAGVRDLVRDGETGLLVRAGDVDALSGALAQLMADPELRSGYGKAARELVRPFSMDNVLDRWEALFEEIDR